MEIGAVIAVVNAAGKGTRLVPLTAEVPKCMLNVQAKPILHRSLDTFRGAGIARTVVIGGYKQEKLRLPDDSTLVLNSRFQDNNILQSLSYARS